MKHIYEITAAGFDGSTDETDDRVLWIAADSREQVEAAIKDTGAKFCQKLPQTCEYRVDFTLTDSGININLSETLLKFASDERNKNRA